MTCKLFERDIEINHRIDHKTLAHILVCGWGPYKSKRRCYIVIVVNLGTEDLSHYYVVDSLIELCMYVELFFQIRNVYVNIIYI